MCVIVATPKLPQYLKCVSVSTVTKLLLCPLVIVLTVVVGAVVIVVGKALFLKPMSE